MKITFLIIGIFAFIGTAWAESVLLDKIVAVVDDEIVLQSDVENKLRMALIGQGIDVRTMPQAELKTCSTRC